MTDLFYVGKIVKAQGIKGEVKIKSDAQSLALVRDHKTLFLDKVPVAVQKFRTGGDFGYALFSAMNDRNQAEQLVGKEVFADKSNINLAQDNYFVSEVVGCEVKLTDGTEIGVVDDVLQNGKSADVFLVRGTRNVLFPFLKDLVYSFDTANKLIVLDAKRFAEVSVDED